MSGFCIADRLDVEWNALQRDAYDRSSSNGTGISTRVVTLSASLLMGVTAHHVTAWTSVASTASSC